MGNDDGLSNAIEHAGHTGCADESTRSDLQAGAWGTTALVVALLLAASTPADAETVLFLVAETPQPFHGDSYVLPISNLQAIAQARHLASHGSDGTVGSIVVAQITAGADGINRNLTQPPGAPWSWHVTQFSGFAEITPEICDGWPTFVESDPAQWIANTGGVICFWNYTVVAELGHLPVAPVLSPAAGSLAALLLGASGAGLLARRAGTKPAPPDDRPFMPAS